MIATIVRLGDEQQVNTHTAGHQRYSSVTALNDGGWLVTWTSIGQDGADAGVYQQRYDNNGVALGAENRVNTTWAGTQNQSSVTALEHGGWLVTWTSIIQDGNGLNVYQQRYDNKGVAIETENRVNSTLPGSQRDSSVTALKDGGWLVTWASGENLSNIDIYQQRYDWEGKPVEGEKRVNSTTGGDQYQPSVTALADGGWLVTWTSNQSVYQKRYNWKGEVVDPENRVDATTIVNQSQPSVTALKDGGWLVTWASPSQDGSELHIYQQRYDDKGNPDTVMGVTKVNTTPAASQAGPSVTALKDGGWLVTWSSQGEDGLVAHQQRYDEKGVAVGPENRVYTPTTNADQPEPSVTGLADGSWLVTWTSFGKEEGSSFGVFQRQFTPVSAFGEGKEHGTGTEGGDVFQVRNGGLSAGDSLEAGDGIDILQMIEAGTLDLNAATLLTGIEIVQGSSGNDVILADGDRLAAIVGFRGGSGTDALHLKAGNYDFTTKLASSLEAITLLGTGSITFADKATALLTNSEIRDGAVTLSGDSFSLAERTQLYHQGIRKVTDAGGVHILQETQASLSMQAVTENAGAGTKIGILSATDPNPGDGLRFELIDDAGGRFALSGDQVVVSNGTLLDYENGASYRILVRVVDEGGIATDAAFTIALSDVAVETVKGTSGNDVLKGGTGKDVLFGGLGKDALTGDKDQDVFAFDTKPNKTSNLDKIVDFSVNDDSIWLDNKVFTKLGKAGTEAKPVQLKKDFFTMGSKAKDKNDYIVYDKSKGVLYYDADGSGKGKAVEIATLSKKLAMTYKDLFVI